MLRSMTGFGKASCELPKRVVTVEIKTLNSKQTDIYLKLPVIYRDAESELRNVLSRKLDRGKIEVAVWYDQTDNDRLAQINQSVLLSYLEQFNEMKEEMDIPGLETLLPIIMRLPDVFSVEKQEFDPEEWAQVMKAIYEAIEQLNAFRLQEGQNLETDISQRIGLIQDLMAEIEIMEPQRVERIKARIGDNLEEHIGKEKIDNNRFEQELIYFLEKLDITEEKVRLKSHCKYFLETVKEDQPIGKKLGFITQEIGREINTIGSKANDKDIQKLVVQMKDELEKIKEQTLNIL